MFKQWIKPGATLTISGILVWFAPSTAVDPWNLIVPQKIATLIFALIFIQIFGLFMIRVLGLKAGSMFTGFFGGLVSSTATTASVAKKSKFKNNSATSSEIVIFLSATFAMLIEALVLVWTGALFLKWQVLLLFLGPLISTIVMIFLFSKKINQNFSKSDEIPFQVLPIIKLSLFIISILLLSKFLQNSVGHYGLFVLTFLVSLFEIHGSVIANIQLYESGKVSSQTLTTLLTLSILASYMSKLFLISSLGSRDFRSNAIKCTLILFLSLGFSFLLSVSLRI